MTIIDSVVTLTYEDRCSRHRGATNGSSMFKCLKVRQKDIREKVDKYKTKTIKRVFVETTTFPLRIIFCLDISIVDSSCFHLIMI